MPLAPAPASSPTAWLYIDPKLPGFLQRFGVDLFLDVGANTGECAKELLAGGYAGRILSFEPLSEAHAQLLVASTQNPLWLVADRCALGAERGEQTLHIAGNLQSSSLLDMRPAHLEAAPHSRYVGSETVPVFTLDEVAAGEVSAASAPFLKIDVQGFENRVLEGAKAILPKLVGLQLELSLVPLYDGEPLFDSLLSQVMSLGFELWWVRPGFSDPGTGRALQMDAIFFRRETVEMTL